MLQLRYDELKKSLDAFTASSVDNLLDKIRHMDACPVPEFNKFESLDLLEALKNAAQDTKHEKVGYYKFAFETLRGKINEPNEQFHNFLLPLLGDKDQEKVLEVVAKVEKNNRQTYQTEPWRKKGGGSPLQWSPLLLLQQIWPCAEVLLQMKEGVDRPLWFFL